MTIIAVSSILLVSLGGGMVFAQSLIANTVVVAAPIITFNDVTLDVTLDADGVGSIEFSDLIDGTTVTTENLASNVIQFSLDPAGPHNARNPNNSGVADGDTFEIPSFQTGAHTVVYNKTHFTFDFDDATFSGSTPNVSFQASIHSAADVLPVEASDIADITFTIAGFETPPAPTITFNDATLDVTLDANGVGSIEFSDLIDGTTVTTENQGSNVIQFSLDPAGPHNARNPNNSGVADGDTFEIPSFQTGAHTVVYNKTHFTFDFDDVTFSGNTPNVSFQASLHSAADALPALATDLANIQFNIISVAPTITFSDTTVDVTLNAQGIGAVRYTDIVNGATVTHANLGSNVIQFILDPNGPHSARNPNAAGVADMNEFQIPSFQTGAHTVVYNKTHFTFDFDDETFRSTTPATTPSLRFQANIQSDANTLPAIDTALANIQFNIIGVPHCEAGVDTSTTNIDFGTLTLNDESSEGTFVIDNTGNMPNNVIISADFWCDASDSSCTADNNRMLPSRTHYGIAPNLTYSGPPPVTGSPPTAKTAFTDFVVGETSPSVDLSTIGADDSLTTYLQVDIELILVEAPDGGERASRFTGDVTQEIWLTYGCDSP